MKTPKLRFKFDSKLDFEIAWDFYNNQKYAGVDFWKKGALQYHDELNAIEKTKRKKLFLSNYIISLYRQHKNEFEYRKKEIKALYKKKEQIFFTKLKGFSKIISGQKENIMPIYQSLIFVQDL